MAELLTFLLVVITLALGCRLFKINSFTVCWFTMFGYLTVLQNFKPRGAEGRALPFLTYLILSLATLYLVKQREERFKGIYQVILAAFIGLSLPLLTLVFVKAFLKFL